MEIVWKDGYSINKPFGSFITGLTYNRERPYKILIGINEIIQQIESITDFEYTFEQYIKRHLLNGVEKIEIVRYE